MRPLAPSRSALLPLDSYSLAACKTAMPTDVADQHDLGVGGDVLLEDWALLLPAEGLVVPRSIQGLSGRKVTQVKPALGTHGHHQVLGETEVEEGAGRQSTGVGDGPRETRSTLGFLPFLYYTHLQPRRT